MGSLLGGVQSIIHSSSASSTPSLQGWGERAEGQSRPASPLSPHTRLLPRTYPQQPDGGLEDPKTQTVAKGRRRPLRKPKPKLHAPTSHGKRARPWGIRG